MITLFCSTVSLKKENRTQQLTLHIDIRRRVLLQTRRHAKICSIIGIRHFVFAVNKMDLVNYDEKIFSRLAGEIISLQRELNLQNVKIIPVSATEEKGFYLPNLESLQT